MVCQTLAASVGNAAIENFLRFAHAAGVTLGKTIVLLMAGWSLLPGCKKPGETRLTVPVDPVYGHLLQAQPRLPTIKVWLGDQELAAEIAREPVQIATGMMFRTNIPENTAMIFIFPDAQPRSFYMRNCVVPLSAAYLAPDGTVMELIDLHPGNELGVASQAANIQFVLEVTQGWFSRHHITPGAMVRTERGSLQETFFPGRRPAPAP